MMLSLAAREPTRLRWGWPLERACSPRWRCTREADRQGTGQRASPLHHPAASAALLPHADIGHPRPAEEGGSAPGGPLDRHHSDWTTRGRGRTSPRRGLEARVLEGKGLSTYMRSRRRVTRQRERLLPATETPAAAGCCGPACQPRSVSSDGAQHEVSRRSSLSCLAAPSADATAWKKDSHTRLSALRRASPLRPLRPTGVFHPASPLVVG